MAGGRWRRPSLRGAKNHLWFKTFGPVARVPCHWCGRPVRFDESVADHDPPLAEGGTMRGRIVIACRPCDAERSRQTHRRVTAPDAARRLWSKILRAEGGCPC